MACDMSKEATLGGQSYTTKEKAYIWAILTIKMMLSKPERRLKGSSVITKIMVGRLKYMKETLFVSFSGGRTSAFMCWWLLNNKSDIYNFIFVFANTSQEHEKTLEFVDKCDNYFNLNLVWIESKVHHDEKKSCGHTIVDFETANRSGAVFEEEIKKYGIPNCKFLHCTRELKLNPIRSYKKSLGFSKSHKMAIGIRADEIDRMSTTFKKDGLYYPLIAANKTKPYIIDWWKTQPFDLDLSEHLGNCITCHKKSDRKLMTIARNNIELFDWSKKMENKYSNAGAGDGNRTFYRSNKSTDDLIYNSKSDFVEFEENKQNYQLSLDIDTLDLELDCGSSCEI